MPARPRCVPHRDPAHAPRRVRLHLRPDLRGPAHQPPELRAADDRSRAPACGGCGPQHQGNTTSSPEEAELVADEISRLLGTTWTNHDGEQQAADGRQTSWSSRRTTTRSTYPRTARRRRTTRRRAGRHGRQVPGTGGRGRVLHHGHVERRGHAPRRRLPVLRNRLNVAISRARCLAYLVCTEELLDARARNVDEMRLIATLNAFVEWAATSKLVILSVRRRRT